MRDPSRSGGTILVVDEAAMVGSRDLAATKTVSWPTCRPAIWSARSCTTPTR
jgi:hypothetical protein